MRLCEHAHSAYPDGLNVRIAMSLTFARTGSAKPMTTRPPEMSKELLPPVTEKEGGGGLDHGPFLHA